MALLAVAATACSEDAPDPDVIDPGSFFPSYGATAYQKCAPNPDQGVFDNTFNVQICRTSNKVGQEVGLAYSVKVFDPIEEEYVEGSKDLFTIPEKFVYTTNEPMGYIPVVAHNELMEIHEPILLTITILDTTSYGASTIEVEYTRVYPEESWTEVSTCTVIDGWVMPIFGLDGADYGFDCQFEVNDADDQLFRLVNPFQSKMYYEPLRSFNCVPAGKYYWLVDLNNFDVPAILPSQAGWQFTPDTFGQDLGSLYVANDEGLYLNKGLSYQQIIDGMDPDKRSVFKDNIFYVNTCDLLLETLQNPGFASGLGQIIFPKHITFYPDGDTAPSPVAPKMTPREINKELAGKFFGKVISL